MSNINFERGYVYSIQYHIVWCVKYKRKVLIDDIEKTLKELLIEISILLEKKGILQDLDFLKKIVTYLG